jgi:hypothetical protein
MANQEQASKAASDSSTAAGGRTTRPDNRLSARALVISVLVAALILLTVVVALQVFVVDKTPVLTSERLDAAREVWEKAMPASYDINVQIRGAQPASARLEVRDGSVTSAKINGEVPKQRVWDVWSVPGMFDTLDRELVLAEDPQHEMGVAAGTRLQLRCEFDSKFGYPRRYHRFATGTAPEVDWRVTEFQPK